MAMPLLLQHIQCVTTEFECSVYIFMTPCVLKLSRQENIDPDVMCTTQPPIGDLFLNGCRGAEKGGFAWACLALFEFHSRKHQLCCGGGSGPEVYFTRDKIHTFCCLGDCFQRDMNGATGCPGKTSETGKKESIFSRVTEPNPGPHLRGLHAS